MTHPNDLVSDPNNSLRVGDTIRFASWPNKNSKRINHVVTEVIVPFWPPLNQRPPVPTEEERIAERESRLEAKEARRAERDVENVNEVVTKRPGRQTKKGQKIEDQAMEHEAQAEEVEGRLLMEGVDLGRRLEQMRV